MPGKRADLVVLAGDPCDLASLKANIRAVYAADQKYAASAVPALANSNVVPTLL